MNVSATELNLEANGCDLLSSEIGQLSVLTKLQLLNSPLKQLPTEIGQLRRLASLHLYESRFTALPTQFGNLVSLTSLSCVNCGLHTVPTNLGRLVRISSLSLKGNNIAKLPTEFGQLTRLASLNLIGNRLSALPSQIGRLSSLTSLLLRNNSLLELTSDIAKCTSLVVLDLSLNRLLRLPTEVGLLHQLTTLDIDGNNLLWLTSAIGKLTQLRELRAGRSQVTELPTQIGALENLRSLDLSSSSRLKSLGNEVFHLTKLTSFGASRLRLATDVLSTLIGKLTNLVTLQLIESGIRVLPIQIGRLTLLTDFGIAQNSLQSLPTEIGLLEKLPTLKLSGLSLISLPTEIGKLTQLCSLEISGTNLSSLPFELFRLTKLTSLCLESNVNLRNIPTQIGHLTNLQLLKLIQKDNLLVIPRQIGKLRELARFTIKSSRKIKALPSQVGHLTKLTSLDLSDNKLEAVPSQLGRLVSLFALNLSGNDLTKLPSELGQPSNLFELDLSSNSKLGGLPTQIGLLTNLSSLYFKGCQITDLPRDFALRSAIQDVDSPSNLNALTVTSDKLVLSWSSPERCASSVTGYTVRIEAVGLQVPVSFVKSRKRQITIQLRNHFALQEMARQKFKVRVLADTPGLGCSLFSDHLTVQTCGLFMERRPLQSGECFAIAGYYKQLNGSAASCSTLEQKLIQGALDRTVCLRSNGTTLENLAVSEGFWRANLTSADIRVCPRREFCRPKVFLHNVSADGTTSPDKYCAENHTGLYCAGCIVGNARGTGNCEFCERDDIESNAWKIYFISVVGLLWLLVYLSVLSQSGCLKTCTSKKRRSRRSRKPGSSEAQIKRSKRIAAACACVRVGGVKVRIFLGYLQVLAAYHRILQVQRTSDQTLEMFRISSTSFTLIRPWLDAPAMRCSLSSFDHYANLLLTTLGPIVFGALLCGCTMSTAYFAARKLFAKLWRNTMSALLFEMYFIYPSVSQVIFETFWCEDFPGADDFNLTTSALRADYTLSCDRSYDERREFFEIYALAMICVYPVGIVLVYCYAVGSYKEVIMKDCGSRETYKAKLGEVWFLIMPYKRSRYWFEVYELLRKLVQTSLIGFLKQSQDPEILAIVSQNLTFTLVIFLLIIRPYEAGSDFGFALVSLLMLLPAAQYSMVDTYGTHISLLPIDFGTLIAVEIMWMMICAWFGNHYSSKTVNAANRTDSNEESKNANSDLKEERSGAHTLNMESVIVLDEHEIQRKHDNSESQARMSSSELSETQISLSKV